MLLISFMLLLASCASPITATEEISIKLLADGEEFQLNLPPGSSAREAFQAAGVEVELLDRAEPPLASLLKEGETVQLIRVKELFELEESVLPFERRILQNESLPLGEERLIQIGANGLADITYRLLFENGELISRTRVSTLVLEEPIAEIIMIGAQAPSIALPISGHLAFLSAGNVWLIEGNTSFRRPLVTSGDLDGRVFELSPDGAWLLFSRESQDEESINTLWLVALDDESPLEIDLSAGDVVHYAGWVPGENVQIALSTVQASLNPPGWQAMNNVLAIAVSASGVPSTPRTLLPSRADSLYSWWGSTYAWSPNGEELAYAQPDSVGIVNLDEDKLISLLDLITYETVSEWAWMPSISWSPDGSRLFTVEHVEQPNLAVQERSPLFDLVSPVPASGQLSIVAQNVGMFANPQASPLLSSPNGEESYWIAYLQAYIPLQSDISAYQLFVTKTDGEEARPLFPPTGAPGLDPQQIAWSPVPLDADSSLSIGLVYQGNLWIVDALSGSAQQITGDGLVTRAAWGQ